MKNPTDLGMNRTGIGTSPVQSKAMLQNMIPPSSLGDASDLLAYRRPFLRDAEPVGTVPMPSDLKGMAGSVMHALKGERMNVLVDKLSERAAFERTGVRLYTLLINKCMERGEAFDSLYLDQIRAIRDDELAHFQMVGRVMKKLGADPTAMSPSANAHAVMSMGLINVLADPRTSILHGFQAILTAELTDNDEWPLLIKIAQTLGLKDEAELFQTALDSEHRHLAEIRSIVHALTLQEAQPLH